MSEISYRLPSPYDLVEVAVELSWTTVKFATRIKIRWAPDRITGIAESDETSWKLKNPSITKKTGIRYTKEDKTVRHDEKIWSDASKGTIPEHKYQKGTYFRHQNEVFFLLTHETRGKMTTKVNPDQGRVIIWTVGKRFSWSWFWRNEGWLRGNFYSMV